MCIYIFIWCHFHLCEALSSLASSLQTLVALVSWRGEGLFSSNVGGHEALLSLRSLHRSLEMLQKQSSRAITRLTSLFSSLRDHSPLLPDVKWLENHHSMYCLFFNSCFKLKGPCYYYLGRIEIPVGTFKNKHEKMLLLLLSLIWNQYILHILPLGKYQERAKIQNY